MDDVTVRNHNGTPTLFCNNEPVFCALHLTDKIFDRPPQWDPQVDAFAQAGFILLSVLADRCVTFDSAYDPHTGEFRPEAFQGLAELQTYVQRYPRAKFLLRVGVEPRGESSAWLRQYPQEREQLEAGAKPPYPCPSYASRLWLRDAKRYLTRLGEALERLGLTEHLFGILVAAGDSGEWVKVGPMEDWAGDYSPAMQRAFGDWLRQRYGDEAGLRAAWGDPHAGFDRCVPDPEAQAAADLYLFKDPVRRRPAIDYNRFLAHLVAQDIGELCAAAKASTGRRHLAGVFYGYLQEMVWNNGFFGQGEPDADVDHSAAARSGHGGLAEVLACPEVDFLCSPYSYGFRGMGGEGGFMSPYESVRRAGKLWISEEDIRTHLYKPDSGYGQARDAGETVTLLKRQFSNILVHGAGAWFCDWWHGRQGVFADPAVMAAFARFQELGQHSLMLPHRESAAQVAVVVDGESSFYRTTRNNFDIPNWRNRAWGLSRMGAPVDYVLLEDVLAGRCDQYRMYFMMNTFHLTAGQRETLKSLLRRDGTLALWLYAPGFADDEALRTEHLEDLAGMALRRYDRQWSPAIYLSDFDHPVTRSLPTSTFWGTDMRLGPLFTVADPRARTLGTAVIQQGRCEPGFALLEGDGFYSVYSAAPNLPAGVLRELARLAGAHIYTEEEDVFYASHNYVMLHTLRAGDKRIRLPRRADVYEAFTGRPVAQNADSFTDRLAAHSTALYYYGPLPLPGPRA